MRKSPIIKIVVTLRAKGGEPRFVTNRGEIFFPVALSIKPRKVGNVRNNHWPEQTLGLSPAGVSATQNAGRKDAGKKRSLLKIDLVVFFFLLPKSPNLLSN